MADKRTPGGGLVAGALLCITGAAFAADADIDRHTIRALADQTPVRAFERDGRTLSVYGQPMAHGATAQASADAFVATQAPHLFGVTEADLKPGVTYGEGAHVRGIMFDRETGAYRKQYHRYTQVRDGVLVFESELKLLVMNQPGFPVVQANSSLHQLGDFAVDPKVLAEITEAGAIEVARRELGGAAVIIEGPTPMIYAGTATTVDVPTLGSAFIATEGVEGTVEFQRYFFIAEPITDRILYRDNQVLSIDVTGNVSAWATDSFRAGTCDPSTVQPMPYARVNIGGNATFADGNGDFVLSNGGTNDVTVDSRVWGMWFRVFNFQTSDAVLSQVVTPPGPADFVHNPSGSEQTLAEVDAYISCNVIRDHVKDLDPGAPLNDSAFRVHVNDTGSCNAFYQGNNLLFLRSGGGCPNTAYSSIVYHEYGHHIVARFTGSQCQWGEGNSDVAACVVSDEPDLAFGFFGNCDAPLRTADNDCEYSATSCSTCGGPCHSCGQLISGCFWDMRNNLLITEPADYRTISGQLWLASLAAHSTGEQITPADTINYLMADDDDGDISNGTPHYFEIANAFSAHNMAPPPLIFLTFEVIPGTPALVSPNGDQTIQLQVTAAVGDPAPNSGVLYFNNGNPGSVIEVPMTEIESNLHEGTFPASDCGNTVSYYFSVDTTEGLTVYFPPTAPGEGYTAVSAVDEVVTFEDDFQNDLGWSVVTTASAGAWVRDIPEDCPDRGAPTADADGSGLCYLTDNDPSCFRDVNFGDTVLTSPTLDASNPESIVSYWRWYDTTSGNNRDDDLVVEVSSDDGATWALLESIAGDSAEAEGGWFFVTSRVGDFVANTDQFRIRFTASDFNPQSINEAAVDGLVVRSLICGDDCPIDLNGSGAVDFADILAILSAWGNPGGPEDLDMGGTVDFQDILIVLANWGPCP